jgi:hypothetical protein
LVSRLRPRDGVSRVASALVVYVPSPLPRWSCWVLIAPFPSSGSFPCEVVRSASTLLFSRPAQRLLTLQPTHSPNRLTILSIEGFRRLVALPSAPIATGWSDPCREGFAPSQELCLSTAHDFITTTSESRFSVHTGVLPKREGGADRSGSAGGSLGGVPPGTASNEEGRRRRATAPGAVFAAVARRHESSHVLVVGLAPGRSCALGRGRTRQALLLDACERFEPSHPRDDVGERA